MKTLDSPIKSGNDKSNSILGNLVFLATKRIIEKKPGVPLKDLLAAIAVGARDEDLFTTLANRLSRLEKQLADKEKNAFLEKANGKTINQVAKELLNAFNPDTLESLRLQVEQETLVSRQLRKKKNLKPLSFLCKIRRQALSTVN